MDIFNYRFGTPASPAAEANVRLTLGFLRSCFSGSTKEYYDPSTEHKFKSPFFDVPK